MQVLNHNKENICTDTPTATPAPTASPWYSTGLGRSRQSRVHPTLTSIATAASFTFAAPAVDMTAFGASPATTHAKKTDASAVKSHSKSALRGMLSALPAGLVTRMTPAKLRPDSSVCPACSTPGTATTTATPVVATVKTFVPTDEDPAALSKGSAKSPAVKAVKAVTRFLRRKPTEGEPRSKKTHSGQRKPTAAASQTAATSKQITGIASTSSSPDSAIGGTAVQGAVTSRLFGLRAGLRATPARIARAEKAEADRATATAAARVKAYRLQEKKAGAAMGGKTLRNRP